MKLLSSKQRTTLSQIAARGFKKVRTGQDFDEWRLTIAKRACGERISEASYDAWKDLFIAFKAAAGEMDEAYALAVEDVTNAQRNTLHLIRAACAEGGVSVGYPLTIARDKWGDKLGVAYLDFDSLIHMPLNALKTVLYDVKRANRRRAERAATPYARPGTTPERKCVTVPIPTPSTHPATAS